MNALIITPYLSADIRSLVDIDAYDLILCADSAYLAAAKEMISPDVVIGDFDHAEFCPPCTDAKKLITVPCEKDDTDTMLCLKYAMESGAQTVDILGGIGGRLDHTFANLQALAYAKSHGVFARLIGDRDEAFLLSGEITLPKRTDAWYLSVFAYSGPCFGVSESGTKYEIENAELTPNFPLGVSNEILANEAKISVKEGTLLLILSRKD